MIGKGAENLLFKENRCKVNWQKGQGIVIEMYRQTFIGREKLQKSLLIIHQSP